MIDWYVEITEGSPDSFKTEKYMNSVLEIANPIMKHFENRVYEIGNWKIEYANRIFSEIIEELPICETFIQGDEFIIKYNKWTYIKLKDKTNQIYRDIKLEKILK